MDLDNEEYYYNKFMQTHISKKEVKEKYISKDKIRKKLKEIENGTYDARIILKQFLEE